MQDSYRLVDCDLHIMRPSNLCATYLDSGL
jgi:hypothetical protein